MAAITEALRNEHRNFGRLLRALEHQVELFADGRAPDYDVIVGVAEYFLDYPDRCHHPKEDLIVSKLEEAHPHVAAAIGDLAGEHDALHLQAVRFRDAVRALLGDTDISRSHIVAAARDFIDAERRHLAKEDKTLLPLADRLLTAADWDDIEDRLRRRDDPLSGGHAQETFRRLSMRILAWQAEDMRAAS